MPDLIQDLIRHPSQPWIADQVRNDNLSASHAFLRSLNMKNDTTMVMASSTIASDAP
jgi:hypothetical protein